jgi:hypothetical protein
LGDPRADAFRRAGLSKNYAMRPRLDATDARNGDVESGSDGGVVVVAINPSAPAKMEYSTRLIIRPFFMGCISRILA